MAICNTNLSPTTKLMSLIPLLLATLLMLINRVNSADIVRFDYKKFTSDQKDLIFQGDATTISNGGGIITLSDTVVTNRVGRVLYSAPILLWESPTKVASFETTFNFAITSKPGTTQGDGLAFFIAAHNTTIPPNSEGKLLGLFSNTEDLNNNIVAVEFDNYVNYGIDPPYYHIGIDVNSIKSKTTSFWDWQDGKKASARIYYDSSSKTLNAVVNYPEISSYSVSYEIELHTVLPQWVRVGFSASTGDNTQKVTIDDWYFSSTLDDISVHNENNNNNKTYIETVV